MEIVKAQKRDLPLILALQKLAYQSEARLLGNDDLPPLKQTLEEVRQEYDRGLFLKGLLAGEIIGSVRAVSDGRTCYIGKLMVDPRYQKRGFGTRLLLAMEKLWPHGRYELFTSLKSADNLRLYEKNGYGRFDTREIQPGLTIVHLEKIPAAVPAAAPAG